MYKKIFILLICLLFILPGCAKPDNGDISNEGSSVSSTLDEGGITATSGDMTLNENGENIELSGQGSSGSGDVPGESEVSSGSTGSIDTGATTMPTKATVTGTTKNTTPTNTVTQPQSAHNLKNGMLLYIGYSGGPTSAFPYPSFSKSDIETLLDAGVTDFILIPFGQYNFLKAGDTSSAILSHSDINGITQSQIGSSSSADLAVIKEEYSNRMDLIMNGSARGLDFLVDEYIKNMNTVLSANSKAKIWFSFPDIDVLPLSDRYSAVYEQHIYKALKSKISATVWKENIAGFYYACEGIVQWYTPFNTNNTTDFNNAIVKNMRYLSNVVHADGKRFMWIPYYRSSASHSGAERIGHVANKTDIFDYVIMQPNYYFNEKEAPWMPLVKASLDSGAVVNYNKYVVGGTKTSKTIVTAELEIDARVSQSSFKARYDTYVSNFKPFVGKLPFVYYAGARDDLMSPEVLQCVREMYK